jgi:hypothetical protein
MSETRPAARQPLHVGFGIAFGPDVRIPLNGRTSVHFSTGLSGLGQEKANINYDSPVASLGGALGIVTAL